MTEGLGCASANGGKDVQQLEQDREFGNKHDGPVKDLELIDNLPPSAGLDCARTLGQLTFRNLMTLTAGTFHWWTKPPL